jgi:PAS domain S-box-containing protein
MPAGRSARRSVPEFESPIRAGGSAARRSVLLAAFGAAVLALVLVGVTSYRATQGLVDAADRLRGAEQVCRATVSLRAALQDVGAGARGFALSGDDAHLATLREGRVESERWLGTLEAAGGEDATLAARLRRIRPAVDERLALADEIVAIRRQTGSPGDARLTAALTRATASTDRAQALLVELEETESRQVAASTEALAARQEQMVPTIAALVALAAVMLVGVVWAIGRERAAMQRTQRTLRSFLDAAPDASIVVDGDGRIVFANALSESLFGWRRDELVGQSIEALVPEAARGSHVVQRQRYTADPRPRPMGTGLELNARRRDGREVPVEISLSPIEAAGGRYVTAAVRDVTERRQAAERLREARTWADSLVETVRQPLVVLDGQLRIVQANRAFYRFFGITARATVGSSLFALAGGQWDVAGLRAALADLLPRGTTLDGFELEQEVPGRGLCNLVVDARPVEREEAGADAILVAIEDVTERRRSERLVVERRALERVNADLQEFAYAASHDLQEPLRKIRTFGDRVLQRWGASLPDEGRDYLARMQNAAARMQKLIDDLLAFSRVSTRAQPFEPVDLGAVAREVVQDLEARIEETGGRVVVEALPTIEADPVQMRQLLQNLLANGLKFHRAGQAPAVRVSGALLNGSQPPACELRVEDDGIGFDEKYLGRIFTIFQRLHGRSEYEGTGLGLAICRKIVERHHGRITAHSAPGRGATFVVTLPLSQGEPT